jgi:hypothetical protein
MKDKWMNIGCEDDELKPFVEPPADVLDPLRIGKSPDTHLYCPVESRGSGLSRFLEGESEAGRIYSLLRNLDQ